MSAEAFARELRRQMAAGFPILLLVTHEERRALDLVRGLVQGGSFPVWSVTDGPDPIEAVSAAQGAGVHAFLDLHPHFGDPRVVRALRDFAAEANRAKKVMLLISPESTVPRELEKEVSVLELPLPTAAELMAVLKREVEDAEAVGWVPEAMVRAARGLTQGEAARAFRMARMVRDPALALARILHEKRRVMRQSATVELVEAEATLDQVGGLEVLKAWLRSRVAAFGEEARRFGLPEPRGMLVCGVQGCGKSLVAKAASRVFGVPLVRLDFAAVFAAASPEHAVRQALLMSEAIAPLVLWVDEIEKGLGGGALDPTRARVFADFLVWLQERRAPVFVAATANEVESLPPELARRGRFDEIFFVDLPAAKERAEILAIHLTRRGRDPRAFSLAELSRTAEHFSGAELEQVVISALFRAFSGGRELEVEDLRFAIGELVPLATLYEEKVQALRSWAEQRARRASADRRTLELFRD
ncbi:MAG: AAA family ATPase [Polyangiaceae bacterium]|nr:AAA family ATPase [Polyangiaceae bacterium]